MINLENIVYTKVISIMDSWDFSDAYSITFFVYSNECFEYRGKKYLTEFNISLNNNKYFEEHYNPYQEIHLPTSKPIDKMHSEQRWNIAYLEMNEFKIFDDEMYDIIFNWYEQIGVYNIGVKEFDYYPNGFLEIVNLITCVAKKIQENEYIKNKCGRYIPIIIQDYEFSNELIEATEIANVHNEAQVFLESGF